MKSKPWKRCWKGKVPRREFLLIYDSNERVALVDSRSEFFFENWLASEGGKIEWFCEVPELPYRNGWLWPQETAGRKANPLALP